MFKITEEALEQEIANYLKDEILKEGLSCELVTQVKPLALRRKHGGQLDILLIIEKKKLVIELEIGKSWGQFAHGIAQAYDYKEILDADGILTIMYPEEVRKIISSQEQIYELILNYSPKVLLLTPFINDFRDEIPLPNLVNLLIEKIKDAKPSVSIRLVVHTLKDCVQSLSLILKEKTKELKGCIFETIGSLKLFQILAEIDEDVIDKNRDEYKIFAAELTAYILINQLLLYHLLMKPLNLSILNPINKLNELNNYFTKIKNINYRPIYQVDVLKYLPSSSVHEINIAILALKAIKPELIPHDLLGRLLHEFLPHETRKHFGAFYTNPIAAELLAWLSINNGNEIVFDPACGSGTLLVAAYNRKKYLIPIKTHSEIIENELIGIDIMPFAAHLTALNLTIQERKEKTNKTKIGTSNSLLLKEASTITSLTTQLELFSEQEKENLKKIPKEIEYIDLPEKIDTIIMNPPFTRKERITSDMKGIFAGSFQKPQNYWAYFLALSDSLLKKGGKIGAVLPRDILKGQFSEEIRHWLFYKCNYNLKYIVKTLQETAFSENAQFRDFLIVLEKEGDNKYCVVIYIKKSIKNLTVQDARELAEKILANTGQKDYEDEDIILVKIPQKKIKENYKDLWKFICCENPKNSEYLDKFIEKLNIEIKGGFTPVNESNIKIIRGYEPIIKNILNAIFIVRPINKSRIGRSQLILLKEFKDSLVFELKGTPLRKKISKDIVCKGLKTSSYLNQISVDPISDFLILDNYEGSRKIEKIIIDQNINYGIIQKNAFTRLTNLVISRKFNLIAPGTKAIAFFSEEGIVPGKAFWSIICDIELSKILAVWLNSTFCLIQIILNRTETEGGWCELTKEDLNKFLVPNLKLLINKKEELIHLFDSIKNVKWPSLIEQFTQNFSHRKSLDYRLLKILDIDNKLIDSLLPHLYKCLLDEFTAIHTSMKRKAQENNKQSLFNNN